MLVRDGLHASIYVVGGAAIAITLTTRRFTRDIDAVFRDEPEALRAAVAEVGARHGLAPTWMYENVRGFVDGGEDDASPVEIGMPGLSVAVASPRHLLAMKMLAGRDRDVDDLAFLFEHLAITAPSQAVAIVEQVFGDHRAGDRPMTEAYEALAEDVLLLVASRQAQRDQ